MKTRPQVFTYTIEHKEKTMETVGYIPKKTEKPVIDKPKEEEKSTTDIPEKEKKVASTK